MSIYCAFINLMKLPNEGASFIFLVPEFLISPRHRAGGPLPRALGEEAAPALSRGLRVLDSEVVQGRKVSEVSWEGSLLPTDIGGDPLRDSRRSLETRRSLGQEARSCQEPPDPGGQGRSLGYHHPRASLEPGTFWFRVSNPEPFGQSVLLHILWAQFGA